MKNFDKITQKDSQFSDTEFGEFPHLSLSRHRFCPELFVPFSHFSNTWSLLVSGNSHPCQVFGQMWTDLNCLLLQTQSTLTSKPYLPEALQYIYLLQTWCVAILNCSSQFKASCSSEQKRSVLLCFFAQLPTSTTVQLTP